eukprot:m.731208 g.731208  ORF g.731208 m.731208 type:complete len:52 (-) comp23057_c0_seq23:1321-1476(-)
MRGSTRDVMDRVRSPTFRRLASPPLCNVPHSMSAKYSEDGIHTECWVCPRA